MNQNKKIIAITGGIGTGKSEVCNILEDSGEICISCDKLNAELLKSREYLDGLNAIFPGAFNNGKLNKSILKEYIAYSDEKRKALNKYSHEKIKLKLINEIEKINNKRLFVEVPLLNQTDYADLFNEIWVVTCNKRTRIERIKTRDGIDEKYAERLIDIQPENYDFKIKTLIIYNEGDLEELKKNVFALLNK